MIFTVTDSKLWFNIANLLVTELTGTRKILKLTVSSYMQYYMAIQSLFPALAVSVSHHEYAPLIAVKSVTSHQDRSWHKDIDTTQGGGQRLRVSGKPVCWLACYNQSRLTLVMWLIKQLKIWPGFVLFHRFNFWERLHWHLHLQHAHGFFSHLNAPCTLPQLIPSSLLLLRIVLYLIKSDLLCFRLAVIKWSWRNAFICPLTGTPYLLAEVPSRMSLKLFSFFNTWKSLEKRKEAGNEVM